MVQSLKIQQNQDAIKTPLLKLFVCFFGHFSIHLRPVCQNWLSALLNLVCFFTIIIGLLSFDPYNVKAGSQWLEEHLKPLVSMILKTDAVFVNPATYLSQVIYIALHGRTIVRLLDDALFANVFRSIGHEKLICLAVLTAYTVGFVVLHFEHIIMEPSGNQGVMWKVVSILCLFGMHQLQCLTLGVLHYVKYATVKALDMLLQKLDPTTTSIELAEYEQIFRQVGTIAKLNRQLHRLISFPLLLFWVRAVVDSVAIICMLQAIHRDYGTFIYFYTCSYSVFIVHLDEAIQQKLLQVVDRLQCTFHTNQIFKLTYVSNLSSMLFHHKKENDDDGGGILAKTVYFNYESPDHVKIRAHQLNLYQDHYRLTLFHICQIDYRFILGMFLFIFQYSVLVIQTGNN